jgi:hypothetical protein
VKEEKIKEKGSELRGSMAQWSCRNSFIKKKQNEIKQNITKIENQNKINNRHY